MRGLPAFLALMLGSGLGGVAQAGVATTIEPAPATTSGATTTAESACGNGVLEGTEQCDDGNSRDGDCCSTVCLFEASGSPCLEDDLCYAATGASCDGSGACVPGALLDGCFEQSGLSTFRLKLHDAAMPGADAIKFRKKTAYGFTDLGAVLGDPLENASYAFCIYEAVSLIPEIFSVLSIVSIPGGSLWTPLSDGWRFRDTGANGSRRLEVRTRQAKDFGTSGYRLHYFAKGKDLPLPGPIDTSRYFVSSIAAGIVNGIGFCALASCCDSPFSLLRKNTVDYFVIRNRPPFD